LRYRGYAAWIFIWAVLVSVSRIFVSMHYTGDVLCGAAVGTLIGLALGFIARLAAERMILRYGQPRRHRAHGE
ncbi:MAG: phosphatase PAP2 family protein, partial [Candidatus Cryptobacteroides sp.]